MTTPAPRGEATTLAKALALIEAHRKVTPEPPGVRYVAVTFECDDDAPRAYIRSVINDAPVVALALVEAVETMRNILACTPHAYGKIVYDCGDPYELARDWLAKHARTEGT